MQVTGTGAVAATWGAQAASTTSRAAAVDTPAVVAPVFARMYDNLTTSDREVLFAATGAWIDADGQLNIPTDDLDKARDVERFASQLENDRRTGALTGDMTTDYLRDLMARVGASQVDPLDQAMLDRAMDFLAARDSGRPTPQPPLDVRA